MIQQPSQLNVLLAARRFYKRDGTTILSLVYTKTGARLEEDEEVLNKSGVYLGDYLQVSRDGSYSKLPPVGGFEVRITSRVAYVRRVPAKLVHGTGMVLFESEYFGRSKCNLTLFNIKMGDYLIDISLLEDPIKMMNGAELHFDATNALPILSGPPPQVPSHASPPVPPRRQLLANDHGFGGNLNQRLEDPLVQLTPQFDAKLNLIEPIQPPVPRKEVELPENTSPTSSISSTLLPAPPRPSPSAEQRYPSPTFSPPTPKPRINTPLVQQPLSSPNRLPQVPTKLLFAARRWHDSDGKPFILLCEPKSGEKSIEEECVLNDSYLFLGDWLISRGHGNGKSYTKGDSLGGFHVEVENHVAYVRRVPSKLVQVSGRLVFENEYFGRSRCNISSLVATQGDYTVDISYLYSPITLHFGLQVSFDATNAVPVITDSPCASPATPFLKPKSRSAQKSKFLFAARRCIAHLSLVVPETGEIFYANESVLIEQGIVLGDWLKATVSDHDPKLLHSFTKAVHSDGLTAKVEGDFAYVPKVQCTLINAKERPQVFKSFQFADILSTGKRLAPGKYFIQISLLTKPHQLPDGTTFYFEGTNPHQLTKNPKPARKFHGAGFRKAENKVIVGAGFGEMAKKMVHGAGFEATQSVKMRAVVINFTEEDGVRTHYLWILDKQTEGRLMQKNCTLQMGHFFEGMFKENDDRKWTCEAYGKGLETLIDGGLDKYGVIFFKVKIEKYTAATGNMKYAEASAKYIGKIMDVDSLLRADCKKEQVRIQRREDQWVIVEMF